MIVIRFEKTCSAELLDCLATGKHIPAKEGKWTQFDMLGLAGACYFAASTHGPVMLPGNDFDSLHPEKKELAADTLLHDLHAAIQFYSQLTRLVYDDEFDEDFEPRVVALVSQEGSVNRSLNAISGFKKHSV